MGYGQYSYEYKGKRTKKDLLNSAPHGVTDEDARKVGNNTLFYMHNGDRCIQLHDTIIVRQHPDMSITLNHGGWHTPTTRRRMNKYITQALGGGYGHPRVYREDYELHFGTYEDDDPKVTTELRIEATHWIEPSIPLADTFASVGL